MKLRRNRNYTKNEWKCGSARNITWVSRLPVGCQNHSATDPKILATQLLIDLVRSMHWLWNNVLNSQMLRWTQAISLIGRLIGMEDVFLCSMFLIEESKAQSERVLSTGMLRCLLCVASIPPATVDSCCVTELFTWGRVCLDRPGLPFRLTGHSCQCLLELGKELFFGACYAQIQCLHEGKTFRLCWKASIDPHIW